MANKQQLALLRRSVDAWNQWRAEHPFVGINLSGANLRTTNLIRANLSGANLSGTTLRFAHLHKANLHKADLSFADLSDADLSDADLSNANLHKANLSDANLSDADLRDANLHKANLSDANLSDADLRDANLYDANLSGVDLSGFDLSGANLHKANLSDANLSRADLSGANLSGANLSDANLIAAQVLSASFQTAILTGACIYDWQIGSLTILEGVECDYIFRTYDEENDQFTGRLPIAPDSTFAPGEFTQRFQIIATALETIDITFTEGIDWQAFFQSFQELRNSRPDEDISIQGMERKGDAFVVRLEVEAAADQASIETQVKQLYAEQLTAIEARYEEQLRLQSEEIAHHRQTQSSLLHIVETMAEKDSITQTFNAPVGNVAGTNYGTMTATINQNAEAIGQLIGALRTSAQSFPSEPKEEALMALDDLEADLSQPTKQEPKRIGRRLQRLMAAGAAAMAIAGGAATVSGDINEFTENVFELGEKVGLAREDIQERAR